MALSQSPTSAHELGPYTTFFADTESTDAHIITKKTKMPKSNIGGREKKENCGELARAQFSRYGFGLGGPRRRAPNRYRLGSQQEGRHNARNGNCLKQRRCTYAGLRIYQWTRPPKALGEMGKIRGEIFHQYAFCLFFRDLRDARCSSQINGLFRFQPPRSARAKCLFRTGDSAFEVASRSLGGKLLICLRNTRYKIRNCSFVSHSIDRCVEGRSRYAQEMGFHNMRGCPEK